MSLELTPELRRQIEEDAALADYMERLDTAISAAQTPAGFVQDVAQSGATGFNKGLVNTIDLFTNRPVSALERLARSGINAASDALGYGQAVNPEPAIRPLIETADRAGLTNYTPITKAGDVVHGVAEGVGGAVPFGVAGGVMGGATQAALGGFGANVAIGAGSGAGAEIAKAAGAPEWAGALAGGLAVAPMAAKAANMGERALQSQPYRDMVDAGVTPRLPGDATGAPLAKLGQAAISPFVSDIKNAASQQIDDIVKRVDELASGLGTASTKEEAGNSLVTGAENFRDAFSRVGNQKYNDLRDFQKSAYEAVANNPNATADDLNNVLLHDYTNTLDVLGSIKSRFGSATNTADEFVPGLYDRLSNSLATDSAALAKSRGLPEGTAKIELPTLQSIRSEIGQMIANPMTYPDVERRGLNELYGALTKDIEAATKKFGPDAEQAYQDAVGFWRDGMGTMKGDLKPLLKDGQSGSSAYNHAVGQIDAGVERLKSIKDALLASGGQAQWNDFASYQIRRLGVAKPGQQNAAGDAFSPATFLTNYVGLKKAGAADVLFDADMKSSLDKLARVAEIMKDSTKYANNSGTAAHNTVLGAIFGASTGTLAQTAAGLLGGKVMAHLFTKPQFVEWLATRAVDPSMTATEFLGTAGRFLLQDQQISDPDLRASIGKTTQKIFDYVSAPSTQMREKMEKFQQSRANQVQQGQPQDGIGNMQSVISRAATIDQGLASELSMAAERSPSAYRAALWKASRDPQKKDVVQQILNGGIEQ